MLAWGQPRQRKLTPLLLGERDIQILAPVQRLELALADVVALHNSLNRREF